MLPKKEKKMLLCLIIHPFIHTCLLMYVQHINIHIHKYSVYTKQKITMPYGIVSLFNLRLLFQKEEYLGNM